MNLSSKPSTTTTTTHLLGNSDLTSLHPHPSTSLQRSQTNMSILTTATTATMKMMTMTTTPPSTPTPLKPSQTRKNHHHHPSLTTNSTRHQSIPSLKKPCHSRAQKPSKINLERFPQETLLKTLASLFDRITSKNDHLNQLDGPATPTSELEIHRSNRSFNSSQPSLSSPTHQTTPPRPPQSPTVTQFQKNHHPHPSHHSSSTFNSFSVPLLQRSSSSSSSSSSSTSTSSPTSSPSSSPSSSSLSSSSSSPSSSHHIHHLPSSARSLQHPLTQRSTASKDLLSNPSSILTFHAKVVPQISVEAYLLRILKYCPTANGVFLSTLIYLDRLSYSNPRVNLLHHHDSYHSNHHRSKSKLSPIKSCTPQVDGFDFVVDSWNVHRFLIASITAASKFLSDVFYTNSRYAKVGGLPLEELEELELKFLLMSDFRLMISPEEFEDYTDRLLSTGNESEVETMEGRMGSQIEDGHQQSNQFRAHPKDSSPLTCDHRSSNLIPTEVRQPIQAEDDGEDSRMDSSSSVYHSPWRTCFSTSSSSSSSSISSCNSSERSSCSTITPHSPSTPSATTSHPIHPFSTASTPSS